MEFIEGGGETPADGEVPGLEVGAVDGVAGEVEGAGDGEAFGHAEAGYEDGFWSEGRRGSI